MYYIIPAILISFYLGYKYGRRTSKIPGVYNFKELTPETQKMFQDIEDKLNKK